ncbi:hypothetical protein HBI56_050970 [Parastagonospora nodorum]|uniref:Uncharacterized protein n=1 Tax=Phaeosphaeria nodorum (strain SN15 / ATCC MYA-4574 / FGSC 10173) TaxID=321614 RepID=A0A7U2ID04_PHANO|nr:hypothetical protein HBH56_241750 [Parastagonospora nodorum]QRD07586.1 hypothetical protein JI435_424630 [Parastagonospora nodorum SN15]KAH3930562.1 hypothetical protein HBH54_115510 [Parastagonospora nodorum]KAH3942853.1 hypothetical protein HBH53_180270 [Parastagonospora nodorum]KAH3964571.1 hypothetical protein HBH51_156560 [Parastagonospora nodorum]
MSVSRAMSQTQRQFLILYFLSTTKKVRREYYPCCLIICVAFTGCSSQCSLIPNHELGW